MNENGLADLMNLIKRQKWDKLFRRRELMHVAACKEFYKTLAVTITNRKEVGRTCVNGVPIELDGMTLARILGVPGNTRVYEYIKDVWEESTYCKPLEITRKFANDELINVARRVKSTKMKSFQRRDDEDEIPVENNQNEEVVEEGQNQEDFEWEAVNEEAEIQGKSGSPEKFYDAEDEVQGSYDEVDKVSEVPAPVLEQQKETTTSGVDPSGLVASISDSDFAKLQAEFERARADKIQAEFDRAQAENARLLALLQQAKSQQKP
ncbi:hypothetical protein Dimus_030567 [Dionaea muscipula]